MGKKDPLCIKHNCILGPESTRYGIRYVCPEPGCTVAWWPRGTSTPADFNTRVMRIEAHDMFDRVWQSGILRRDAAYTALANHLKLSKKRCHIGMFDKQYCRKTIDWSRTILVLFGKKNDDKAGIMAG